eukprot:9499003-Pyramimonas_sp.AAC.1
MLYASVPIGAPPAPDWSVVRTYPRLLRLIGRDEAAESGEKRTAAHGSTWRSPGAGARSERSGAGICS